MVKKDVDWVGMEAIVRDRESCRRGTAKYRQPQECWASDQAMCKANYKKIILTTKITTGERSSGETRHAFGRYEVRKTNIRQRNIHKSQTKRRR